MADTANIEADDNGIRLDRWFKRHYPALTHGKLEKLLRTGQVRLDGKRAKAAERLSTGQTLRLPPQLKSIHSEGEARSTDSQAKRPQAGEQERTFAQALVIHQDSSVMVLNKPSGLATQGGSGLTKHVDGMLDLLTFGKKQRPRLVHRLDRDTSGVLVIARTVPAAAKLAGSLAHRDAQKIYWALVRGVPEKKSGTIKLALVKQGGHGPHGKDERVVGVDRHSDEGKFAMTDYVVVDHVGKEYAWIAAKPVTGRTHQIRVHLASLGTPIVGDFKYGGAAAKGAGEIEDKLHLHARTIDITHPDGGRLNVTAPLSPHMKKSWKFLGFTESDAPKMVGGKKVKTP
ncbi:MAG TPA: RluA family pseudouridine synthase [Rhizomicrobium sp.]|jgi:23S rRNA pseudouridine955/2504/2580 synthase|nr:RluA family pseudouridine synthase [Rhizomicrobium sp.]